MVQKLEQAYKSLKIPYPKDTVAGEIEQQESEYKRTCDAYVPIANSKIAEAEKLVIIEYKLQKFISYF